MQLTQTPSNYMHFTDPPISFSNISLSHSNSINYHLPNQYPYSSTPHTSNFNSCVMEPTFSYNNTTRSSIPNLLMSNNGNQESNKPYYYV